MSLSDFKPASGIGVLNKKGQVVLWVRAKQPEDASRFLLYGCWPERADTSQLEKLPVAMEFLKAEAKEEGFEMYNIEEINAELAKFIHELQLGPRSNPREEITITVTDVLTGRKNKMHLNITIGPEKAGD